MQEGRPVASVFRSLTKSENYVAIELECLAIVFACQKFNHYIFGNDVRIETDHKPYTVSTAASAAYALVVTAVLAGSCVQTRRTASVGRYFVKSSSRTSG